MEYCYKCGTELTQRHLDGEGDIPYCEKCEMFLFPKFNAAVSMIVQSPDKKNILLIRQYGRNDNILVAGYINKGENAEQAAVREIMEETGLDVHDLRFNKSEYFAPSETLMINFSCTSDSTDLSGLNTGEVDFAAWYPVGKAAEVIKPDSLAKRFLMHFLDGSEHNNGL